MALNVLAYINYDSGINVHGVHIPLTHRRTIAWDTLTERFYLTETTQLGGHTWMVRFSPTKKEAFVYPGIFIELCDTLNHAVWLHASKNFEEIAISSWIRTTLSWTRTIYSMNTMNGRN